jgi:hypothetical protein
MYPRYPDVIRTIQQNLMREIIPDLSTDYAREQATGILVLLEHLVGCWDRAADILREENTDLRKTLRKIARATGGGIGSEEAAKSDHGVALRGEELMAENRDLRSRLATIIATAADGSAELRLAKGFMARQVGRETAAVTGVAPTWD